MDLSAARAAMVDSQVRTNDVTDRRLIRALGEVAREAFVPAGKGALAYVEQVIETSPGRHLWLARDISKLLQAATVEETDTVLDIAAGSGYSAAVLSKLAARVVALEESEAAVGPVRALGLANVETVSGPLKAGAPAKGPYNVIFVNGAVEEVPQAWLDQLAEGGRLAVVVDHGAVRRGCIVTRSGGRTASRTVFDSAAPSLPGFEKAAAFRL
jgi:protein-L-isoaspartate(D-aspartate) O-methyltransferase